MELSRFAFSLASKDGSRIEYLCGLRVKQALELSMWTSKGDADPYDSTLQVTPEDYCFMREQLNTECSDHNHVFAFIMEVESVIELENRHPHFDTDGMLLRVHIHKCLSRMEEAVKDNPPILERVYQAQIILSTGLLMTERVGTIAPNIAEVFQMEADIARIELGGDDDGTVDLNLHC